MFVKVLLVGIFVGFACLQLATSLQCFECTSPSDCKSPKRSNCDVKAANRTREHLRTYFDNISNTTSSNFECLHMNYTSGNTLAMETRGCIFTEITSCSMNINDKYAQWKKENCTVCSGDYCNGHNPAAAVAPSTIFTLLSSAVMILAAKVSLAH